MNKLVTNFPDRDEHLDNYVVARPDHRQYSSVHAERFLIDRFEALRQKCQEFSTIIVYSWLMPCSECTEALIDKFDIYVGGHSVIVVYNTDQVGKDVENQNSRNRLEQAGIKVYKVRYYPTLPPTNN